MEKKSAGGLFLALTAGLMLIFTLAAASCGTAATPAATLATTTNAAATSTTAAASTNGATAAVVIENYLYSPETLTVKAGTTVTWTNKDSVSHTVTTKAPLFDSGLFGKSKSYSYTFTRTGSYEYYCIPHPYMVGKVIVE
jgi:amicyanin